MVIGLLAIELHFPYAQSLKEKRKALGGFKDRIRKKFNIAIAELDYHDKWQRAKIGILTLNTDKRIIDGILHRVVEETEKCIDGEILDYQIHYF